MKKARDLLLETSLYIIEISRIVGYEKQLYFSRLFKKKYGYAPRDCRMNYFKLKA
jgi:AraC-like DNA-binding protein